ncbi:hypothetical protein [Peribacillus sp. SCS-37]
MDQFFCGKGAELLHVSGGFLQRDVHINGLPGMPACTMLRSTA